MRKYIVLLAIALALVCTEQMAIATGEAICDGAICKVGSIVHSYNGGAGYIAGAGYCYGELATWLQSNDAEDTGKIADEQWYGVTLEGPVEAHLPAVAGYSYFAYSWTEMSRWSAAHSPQTCLELYTDDDENYLNL